MSNCDEYPGHGKLIRSTRELDIELSHEQNSTIGDAGEAVLRIGDIVEVIQEHPEVVWWPAKNAYIRFCSWWWFETI